MSRLRLNKYFVVDGQGKGGGLALYWFDSIKVDILSYGMHHIDTMIWDDTHHAGWRGAFIYMGNLTPSIDMLCGNSSEE
jgi:hypothetical protein